MDISNFIYDPYLLFYHDPVKHDGNNFPSDDKSGWLLAPSAGALPKWTKQGRDYDGVDDDFTTTPSLPLSGMIEATVISWFKTTDNTIANQEIVYSGTGAAANQLALRVDTNTLVGIRRNKVVTSNANEILNNNWYCGGFVWRGGDAWGWLYKNGIEIKNGTVPVAGMTADSDARLSLGIQWHSGLFLSKGLIGECFVFNRALNPAEMQRLYLATKWRYA